MKAKILIVGDYPALAMTRAELLRDWQIVTTGTKGASDVIRVREYDMLLFCQTVSESTARELAAQAIELNPGTKVLAISDIGQVRQLGSGTFVADLHHPSRLRSVVAAHLQSNGEQTSQFASKRSTRQLSMDLATLSSVHGAT
jgi:hypothetical protein